MRRIVFIAAAAGLLAPQAARADTTLAPLKPCYRSVDQTTRENVAVAAGGFTPGQPVDVLIDGQVVRDNVLALPNGAVIGDVSAPYRASGERGFTLTVTEQDKPTNTISATSRVTALSLRLKPRKARPSRRVRFIGRGFTDGETVFAHYVRGGRVRKTVSLGAPTAPCGTIDVKRRQIPVKKPKTGRWTLQVDNQAAYSNQPASVFVRLAIVVRRVLRGG